MNDPLTRAEHLEHVKRMEDEHKRINRRLEKVERDQEQITNLTMSVREMTVSMNKMLDEQKEQGERLDELESRDGEMWRKVSGYTITAIIGLVLGFVFNQMM